MEKWMVYNNLLQMPFCMGRALAALAIQHITDDCFRPFGGFLLVDHDLGRGRFREYIFEPKFCR